MREQFINSETIKEAHSLIHERMKVINKIEKLTKTCDSEKIRVEVLVGNLEGISFWHAVGFKDYCITMEINNQ